MPNKPKITRALRVAIKQINNILDDLRSCRFYMINLRKEGFQNPCHLNFKSIELGSPNKTIYEYIANLFSALDYPIMLTNHFDSDHEKLLHKFKKLRCEYLPVGTGYYGNDTYDKALEAITAYNRFLQALKRRILRYNPQQITLRGKELKQFLIRSDIYGARLSIYFFARLIL